MVKVGSNFCIAPWATFYASPAGAISPCCRSHDYCGKASGDLLRDWNNDGLRKIRTQFLNNERPEGCRDCYSEEEIGRASSRQRLNQSFVGSLPFVRETAADGTVPRLNIKQLDIRWSNLCNFKCNFCSFEFSSSWLNDYLVRYDKYFFDERDGSRRRIEKPGFALKPDISMEQIKTQILPHVKHIHFLGGEPLVMSEFYQVLDHLIELGRTEVNLTVTTNGSRLSHYDEKILPRLKHFQTVIWTVSLDGIGREIEYVRKGARWEDLENNFLQIQDFAKQRNAEGARFTLKIFHSVTAQNAFHSVTAMRYYRERWNWREIALNLCHSPDFYRIDVLPRQAKEDLLKLYESHDRIFYGPLISWLKNDLELNPGPNEQAFSRFVEETSAWDKVRGESFLKVFPEFLKYPEFEAFNHVVEAKADERRPPDSQKGANSGSTESTDSLRR